MAQHNPLQDLLEGGGVAPPSSVPVDAQGNKIDPTGRGIDDFLRSLLGGVGVPGVLPPSNAATVGINGTPSVPTGIQAAPTPQDLPIPPIPAGNPVPPTPDITSTPLPSSPITGASGLPQPGGVPPTDNGLDTVGQQVPSAGSSFNSMLIGPGDALSGVLGRSEGEPLQTPGEDPVSTQLLNTLFEMLATGASPVLGGPRVAGTLATQGAKSIGSGAASGIGEIPSLLQAFIKRLGLNSGSGAARRAGIKAKGNIRRGQTKRRAGVRKRQRGNQNSSGNQ